MIGPDYKVFSRSRAGVKSMENRARDPLLPDLLGLARDQLGPVVRGHWSVENSLHWFMDMIFRDDECRVRTDHAPANFTTLKHVAHNLIRRAPGKGSSRLRRKVAAWDDEFLVSLVTA
jgi:predicted transposase YbfD/YdcC